MCRSVARICTLRSRSVPKRILEPNTTLYPVPVVLITADGSNPNVMTCNRISSCSTEPPRLVVSIRPGRYSHSLVHESREFVVNIPAPKQSALADYIGFEGLLRGAEAPLAMTMGLASRNERKR